MYYSEGMSSKMKPKLTHTKPHTYGAEWLKDNQHTLFLILRDLVCLEWFVLTDYSLIKMKAVINCKKIWHAGQKGSWQSAEEEI
jgi:hypothetical protein